MFYKKMVKDKDKDFKKRTPNFNEYFIAHSK